LQVVNSDKPKLATHNLAWRHWGNSNSYVRDFSTLQENVNWLIGCKYVVDISAGLIYCLRFSSDVWNKQG